MSENRLNRIAGQVRGVAQMIENDRYCMDILHQIQAVKSALAKVESQLLKDHAACCVAEASQRCRERAAREVRRARCHTRKFAEVSADRVTVPIASALYSPLQKEFAMLHALRTAIARRSFAGAMFVGTALSACAAQAATFTMYRDPNCGCCLAWADHMEQGDKRLVETVDHPDMASVKAQNGVPDDLRSCHTVLTDGYVIEGHVPATDVERLLAERPEGIIGLAVAGMPMGSPGMELGDHRQPFQVIAFGPEGRSTWASYPAEAS